jgi:beta-mannosidase
MTRQAHTPADPRRLLLDADWELCAAPPKAGAPDPAQAPTHGWQTIGAPQPAAAALRALGQWSLEGSPRRFDAEDWWYRLRFDLPEGVDAASAILGFDGLATIACAWLNSEPLLTSDNMHRAHRCDAAGRLRAHDNELLLHFGALDAALAARRPRPRWRTPMVEHAQLRWWRTTLLGRTPGWTPPCAVVGPWRDIWLSDQQGLRADGLELRTQLDGSDGLVEVVCELRNMDAGGQVELELQHGDKRYAAPLTFDGTRWHGQLRVPRAERWWPHTHGQPALYDACLQVQPPREEHRTIALRPLGFRTLDVRQDDGDFAIAVNGVDIFCRGACWTPLDPVTLRGTADVYAGAVRQVRDAGMNMLRICGPMVYEDDALFDACDREGVLVWQDFMFANMDYPQDDPAFVANVQAEVEQQARRWQGRPSLAVLCGNSEGAQQAAMSGADRALWAHPLFHETIPAVVRQVLPGTAYWPSSAWGGAFPHQVSEGTTSYYGVGAYLRDLDDARRSGLRFATECLAFANVPDTAAIARVGGGPSVRVTHAAWKQRAPRDLGAGWDFEDVRDHYLAQLFDLDPARLRYADHERYLELSRLASAEMMARSFAEWRRAGSACRGALIWFLRDFWAGAGWGVLDERGAPKACWHALARVLQPRTVLLTDEGNNGYVAHLVNEGPEPLAAQLDVAAWRGDVLTCRGQAEVELAPRETRAVPVLSLLDHFADLNHAFRFGPLAHDTVVATLRDASGHVLGRAFQFPGGMNLPREASLGLSATASAQPDGTVRLEVQTQRLAVGVRIEANGWTLSDDGFHLPPGEPHMVTLHPAAPAKVWRCTVSAANLSAPVTVKAPHALA